MIVGMVGLFHYYLREEKQPTYRDYIKSIYYLVTKYHGHPTKNILKTKA